MRGNSPAETMVIASASTSVTPIQSSAILMPGASPYRCAIPRAVAQIAPSSKSIAQNRHGGADIDRLNRAESKINTLPPTMSWMRLTGGLTFSHRHSDGNEPGFREIRSFVFMLVVG